VFDLNDFGLSCPILGSMMSNLNDSKFAKSNFKV
jgi:hypothetical protein